MLQDLRRPLVAHSASEVASCVNGQGVDRLNAALHLLSAGLCGYRGHSAIVLATILDLTSAGSKLHHKLASADRGSWRAGWAPTILAGDWAYLQAIRPAVELRNFRVLDLLIDVTKKLVEGDLLESEAQKQSSLSEKQMLDLYYYRTACLFALSARLGAVIAGSEMSQEKLLNEYGLQIGYAWRFATDTSWEPARRDRAAILRREAAVKAESCLAGFPDCSHKRALESLAGILREKNVAVTEGD